VLRVSSLFDDYGAVLELPLEVELGGGELLGPAAHALLHPGRDLRQVLDGQLRASWNSLIACALSAVLLACSNSLSTAALEYFESLDEPSVCTIGFRKFSMFG